MRVERMDDPNKKTKKRTMDEKKKNEYRKDNTNWSIMFVRFSLVLHDEENVHNSIRTFEGA